MRKQYLGQVLYVGARQDSTISTLFMFYYSNITYHGLSIQDYKFKEFF